LLLHFWDPCAQFCLCCHLQSKHVAPLWPLDRVIAQSFCHFFHFNVLDAKEIKVQRTSRHAVKYRDYLVNHGIISSIYSSSSMLKSRPFPWQLQPTPAMFICLLYAVYRTQLLKPPVIKNMLCKQNWNGGKTDCVHLAFRITNQAEGYNARFSVSLSLKGKVTHCSVPVLLWDLMAFFFPFRFLKMWYFCRLYWLLCFFGSVKPLPTNLRK